MATKETTQKSGKSMCFPLGLGLPPDFPSRKLVPISEVFTLKGNTGLPSVVPWLTKSTVPTYVHDAVVLEKQTARC